MALRRISLFLASIIGLVTSLAPPDRLRQLLNDEMSGARKSDKPILLPCCYDGLSARMVALAGFEAVSNPLASPPALEQDGTFDGINLT